MNKIKHNNVVRSSEANSDCNTPNWTRDIPTLFQANRYRVLVYHQEIAPVRKLF